ncbi:MAG: hypothetical protein QTN59_18470 [Candidatus Electrothrix communis]|nr:MAG: hypothetical protein QTN59_18470 [Candidatus Electrothrix communis]
MSEAGEQVIQNSCPYKVDGEAGRFAFFTHSILKGADVRYNTGQDVFSLKRPGYIKKRIQSILNQSLFFWIRRRLTTQSLFVQKYVAFLMVT